MPTSPAIEAAGRRGAAFTLVELMVSLSVLSVLVLLLTNAFNAASSSWTSGEAGTERRRSARALTDSISSELQGALAPVEGKAVGTRGDLELIINPDDLPDYQNGDAIFWQAPIATENSFGDVAEVGYFVKWDTTVPSAPVPQLCRFFVNPSVRDSGGNVTANPDFLIYSPTDPLAWRSLGLISRVAPADRSHGYAGLFADNVVGLWAHAYGLDGHELTRKFDSRTGYPNNFQMSGAKWSEQRYLPSHIQISLAQIDSRHVGRLAPVWTQVRDLTRQNSIRNAADFETALRNLAGSSGGGPGLAAVLPWLRTYSADVYLENAR